MAFQGSNIELFGYIFFFSFMIHHFGSTLLSHRSSLFWIWSSKKSSEGVFFGANVLREHVSCCVDSKHFDFTHSYNQI